MPHDLVDDIMLVPEIKHITRICSSLAAIPLGDADILDIVLMGLVLAAHHPKTAGIILKGLSTLNPLRVKDIKELLDEVVNRCQLEASDDHDH